MNDTDVRVICADHKGKRTTVATMTRGHEGRWYDRGGPRRRADGMHIFHDSSATVGLVGDQVARDDVNAPDHEDPQRYRHVLRCARCGLTATLRGERFDVLLDAFVANGLVAEGISLRMLTSL